MSYSLETLEFERLLDLVGRNAQTPMGRERILHLRPHVNRRDLEEALAAARPLVPHDNDSTLTLRATTFLNTPEVLHGLHIADGTGPLRFTFERDGRRCGEHAQR